MQVYFNLAQNKNTEMVRTKLEGIIHNTTCMYIIPIINKIPLLGTLYFIILLLYHGIIPSRVATCSIAYVIFCKIIYYYTATFLPCILMISILKINVAPPLMSAPEPRLPYARSEGIVTSH